MGIIETLLAVRQTSCNNICLVEYIMPTLKAAIPYRQYKYLTEKFKCLEDNSPLKFALNLVKSVNTASYKLMKEILGDSNIINKDKHKLVNAIKLNTVSSKRATYISMNPSLYSPKIYQNDTINEYKRIQYNRLRLPSHYLSVEIGRWSRTPQEERLCTCLQDVQTENNIVFQCELTAFIRLEYHITVSNLVQLFNLNAKLIASFVYDVIKKMY